MPKADNLLAVARDLNVDPSSLLFIDDNPAELSKALGMIPGLRVLLADPGGEETASALAHYPGLWSARADQAASIRTADVRANREREQLKLHATDQRSYLAALRMEVTLHDGNVAHVGRVHDLSNKTNQFNLALKRLSPVQAQESFGQGNMAMTVSLKDALSDSGVVGAILARVDGTRAVIAEVLFSCRVLGRDVETLALMRFLRWLEERGVERVRFEVAEGQRNHPARDWLKRFVPGEPEGPVAILKKAVEQACVGHPAAIVEEHR